jgi:succinate dehydrogenase/fumarate reductase iron-sulfur protein
MEETNNNQNKPLIVKIRRYNPEFGGELYWETFEVPRNRASRVLDALEYIQDVLDPSLGYRRHICHNLVCRSCFVQVDGHSRMTCQTVIKPTVTDIRVEPLPDYELVRDLIVDFSRPQKAE